MTEERKNPFLKPQPVDQAEKSNGSQSLQERLQQAKAKSPFGPRDESPRPYGLDRAQDMKYRFKQKNPDITEYFRIACKEGEVFVLDQENELIDPDLVRAIAYDILRTVDKPLYVYVGYSKTRNQWKVGMSQNVEKRAQELGIEVFHTIKCERFGPNSARNVERRLLDFLKKLGVHQEGEWFLSVYALPPLLACFKNTKEVFERTPKLEALSDSILPDLADGSPVNFSEEHIRELMTLTRKQHETQQILVVFLRAEFLLHWFAEHQRWHLAYTLWFSVRDELMATWDWGSHWQWPYEHIDKLLSAGSSTEGS